MPHPVDLLDKKDPLASARRFRRELYSHPDGDALCNAGDVFYAFNGSAYAEVPGAAIRSQLYKWLEPRMRLVVRGENESIEPFKPTKTDADLITDALKAIAYTAHQSPSWLIDAANLPDPAQLAVARNGIFDLADDSGGMLMAPTPKLFTTNYLDYDYVPDGPEPVEWLHFLGQLWPKDPQSITLLREWFGYCLSADTSQQKILMLVGPMRSGKGTIARVLARMLGVQNVCGPTLSSLSTNFGLWALIGKQIAIISDARLSGAPTRASSPSGCCPSAARTHSPSTGRTWSR